MSRDATALDQVMVGTVKAKWRLKYLGRVIEDCVLLTDVWVNDEGRWQAIRRHSTPAPARSVPSLKATEGERLMATSGTALQASATISRN